MGRPNSSINFYIPNAAPDGRYYSRYPDGDKPQGLAFDPAILISPQNGTLGENYMGSGANQWSSDSSGTTVDDSHLFRGRRNWKCHAFKGRVGGGQFGSWGGIKTLGRDYGKGDVVHVQVPIYFPQEFDWRAKPWLKFIRFRTQNSDNSAPSGFNDLYIYNDGSLHTIKEIQNIWFDTSAVLQKDRYEVIEFQVSLDNVPADQGGTGRHRVWQKQGNQMINVLDKPCQTLNSATDICNAFYLSTYLNSGNEDGTYPPYDMDCYVGEIAIEFDQQKLIESDQQGRKIIGGIQEV